MEQTKNVIEQSIDNLLGNLEYTQKRLALTIYVSKMFEGLDLSDFASTYIYGDKERPCVDFRLDSEKRDSKVMHKLARKFNMKFDKSQNWEKTSLVYTGRTADGLQIEITGAVPQTCTVIEKEVPLTEEEIAEAIAKVPRVKIEREIHCNGSKKAAA